MSALLKRVLISTFMVAFVPGAAIAQEARQTAVSPQERVATACQNVEAAFASGDVNGGCRTALDTLRSLNPDQPELVDLTTEPLHLLVFGMCALMLDEPLADFLDKTVDPETYPIDDAVLLFFNLQYTSVDEGRAVPAAPLAEQVGRAERMAQSAHGLVRALGLMTLSWYVPENIVGESARNAFNGMAELCPEAKVTREVLHRLLLVAGGDDPANSSAVQDLLTRSDWNSATQAVIADDSVVELLRDITTSVSETPTAEVEKNAAASKPGKEGISRVLTAAKDRPEKEVMDWCLRLVHANAGEATADMKAYCEAVRSQSEAVSKSAGATVQPLETLRARHVLFSQALAAKELDAAGTQLDALLSATAAEEPVDANTHMNVLLDAMEYGLQSVMAGDYAKSLATYERVALKYPNSEMGKRAQEHVDHIKAVIASQEK